MFSLFTDNHFEFECFGALGGTDTNNLTSFYLKWGNSKLLIDGGSLPIQEKEKWSNVDLILLTHSHLDHTADILRYKDELHMPIVTDLDTPLITFHKSILLHDKEIPGKAIPGKEPTLNSCDNSCNNSCNNTNFETFFDNEKILILKEFVIQSFPLHHHKYCSFPKIDADIEVMKRRSSMFSFENTQNICRSHCFVIQHRIHKGAFVFFGDFTTAFGNKEERQEEVDRIVNNIKQITRQKIDFMVVECAMSNSVDDNCLFGHMKPDYLSELWFEMKSKGLIDINSVAIINHMKPNLTFDAKNLKLKYDYSPLQKIRDEISKNDNHLTVAFCDQFDKYYMSHQNICGFTSTLKSFDESKQIYKDATLEIPIFVTDSINSSVYYINGNSDSLKNVCDLLIISPSVFSLNFQLKDKKFAFALTEEEFRLWNFYCNNCIWPELFKSMAVVLPH